MTAVNSRRGFIKNSLLTSAALAVCPGSMDAAGWYGSSQSLTFLFQGDSITDGNRGRSKDPNHIMGHGYAFAIASRIGADFAESNHLFYNRGISGNRITDLENRWQTDTLDLKPDVLSILVGINDAAAQINKPVAEADFFDQFEKKYRSILQLSKQQNPDILFVLCLPFAFPVAKVKDNWERYRTILAELVVRTKTLATEFNTVLVDFTPVFEKGIKKAPPEYWIWDGIHPTVPGHELMAREWMKQVSKRLKFLRKYKY